MRVTITARVSALLFAVLISAGSLYAAPAGERPVNDPSFVHRIVGKFAKIIRSAESMLSVPKP